MGSYATTLKDYSVESPIIGKLFQVWAICHFYEQRSRKLGLLSCLAWE